MKEYIEREALIKEGWLLQRTVYGNGSATIESKQLKAIPAADVVEVRRGRWVDGNGNPVEWDPANKSCPKSSCYCSVCGEWLTASDEYPSIGNFCPNCGAKMDGGVNDG